MVFDLHNTTEYESGQALGLLEEPSWNGWAPRTFMVANGGLMPAQFNVIYETAVQNLSVIPWFAIITLLILGNR